MNKVAFAFALLLLAHTAAAQWTAEERTPPGTGATQKVAVAHNQRGDSLLVWRDAGGQVRGALSLHPSPTTLATDTCPSYRVDQQPPQALVTDTRDNCRVEARRVEFTLGSVENDRVNSATLLALMNGTRIRFVYALRGLGYARAGFDLSGSKQAINEALAGARVVEQP